MRLLLLLALLRLLLLLALLRLLLLLLQQQHLQCRHVLLVTILPGLLFSALLIQQELHLERLKVQQGIRLSLLDDWPWLQALVLLLLLMLLLLLWWLLSRGLRLWT
jgi:hypothetical protein